MFLSGLPVHVLVVHAVVVLVPLATLGAVLIAVWPAARRRYGWLVLGVTVLATAVIPVATQTGEGLEHNLPRTPLMAVHTHLGDQLLPFAGLLLVLVAAVMLVSHGAGQDSDQRHGHRMDRASEGGTTTATATWVRPVALTLSTLTVAAAAVTAVQVVRIGDSGARAAWGDTQYVQQAPEHGGDDG